MVPLWLTVVAGIGVVVTTTLTVFLYLTLRSPAHKRRWTYWRSAPMIIASVLLVTGSLPLFRQPTQFSVSNVEITSSTVELIGAASTVLALSVSTICSCWFAGTLLLLQAQSFQRATWWC